MRILSLTLLLLVQQALSQTCPPSTAIEALFSSTSAPSTVASSLSSSIALHPKCYDLLTRSSEYLLDHRSSLPASAESSALQYLSSAGSLVPSPLLSAFYKSSALAFLSRRRLQSCLHFVSLALASPHDDDGAAFVAGLSSDFFGALLPAAEAAVHYATRQGVLDLNAALTDLSSSLSRMGGEGAGERAFFERAFKVLLSVTEAATRKLEEIERGFPASSNQDEKGAERGLETTRTRKRDYDYEVAIIDGFMAARDWKALIRVADEGLKMQTAAAMSTSDVAGEKRNSATPSSSSTSGSSKAPLLNYHYYLGVAYYNIGEVSLSVSHLRIAAQLSPTSPAIVGTYGDALLTAFDLDGALKAFQAATILASSSTPSSDAAPPLLSGLALRYAAKSVKASSWLCDWSPSAQSLEESVASSFLAAADLAKGGDVAAARRMLGGASLSDFGEGSSLLERIGGEGVKILAKLAPINEAGKGSDDKGGASRRRAIERYEAKKAKRSGEKGGEARRRPLRVGFISSDWGLHPVAILMRGLMAYLHKSDKFEPFAFSLHGDDSSWWYKNITATLNSDAAIGRAHFVDLSTLSLSDAAALVESHDLDVLVDMNGHTYGSGLPILSYRPCHAQVSFLGLPQTTASSHVDYYITDAVSVPPDSGPHGGKEYFTESLAMLQPTYIVNDYAQIQGHTAWRHPLRPYGDGLFVSASSGDGDDGSLVQDQDVLIACFSNFQKIDVRTIDVWANALRMSPRSKIVFFKYKSYEQAASRLELELRARGVNAAKRVLWADQASWIEHTWIKSRFDLALDTLGKNGHTTGLDGAWAGVPTVVLDPGGGGMGVRAGISISAGLFGDAMSNPLVAVSAKDYEDVAVKMIGDGRVREGARESLARARVRKGGAFDLERYGLEFGRTLESIAEVSIAIGGSRSEENGKAKPWHIYGTSATSRGKGEITEVGVADTSNIEEVIPLRSMLQSSDATLSLSRSSSFLPSASESSPLSASSSSSTPLKLHIGGRIRSPDWTIVDAAPLPGIVDVVSYMGSMPMFLNGTVSEIYSSHALEHAHYGEVAPISSKHSVLEVLREWWRVLKVGGDVMISVPDMSVLVDLYREARETGDKRAKFLIMRILFGGQTDPYDAHFVGLDEDTLGDYLYLAGFCGIRRVVSFDLFDDSSTLEWSNGVKISLNVVAKKCLGDTWA